MTDKAYAIVTVNGKQYHVTTECARMLEAVCKDERYQHMFSIPFDWLRLTVNQRGKAIKVEVTGG